MNLVRAVVVAQGDKRETVNATRLCLPLSNHPASSCTFVCMSNSF